MAKLLTREDLLALSPGDHVWVEYGWGTADEWVVGTIYFDHPELKGMWRRWNRTTVGHVFNIETDPVLFWDSEPTIEELTTGSELRIRVWRMHNEQI